MANPKKRTSNSKKNIRKSLWKKKGDAAAQKAFCLGKSVNDNGYWSDSFWQFCLVYISFQITLARYEIFRYEFECDVRRAARNYKGLWSDFARFTGLLSRKETRILRIEKRINRRAKKRVEKRLALFKQSKLKKFKRQKDISRLSRTDPSKYSSCVESYKKELDFHASIFLNSYVKS